MDNESYESTGGQPSITDQVDLAKVATSCGYQNAERIEDGEQLALALASSANAPGPRLILAKVGIAPVEDISRVTHSPIDIRDRFSRAVGKSSTPGIGLCHQQK